MKKIWLTLAVAFLSTNGIAFAWTQGEFLSGGQPVQHYVCASNAGGPGPAVILLHGAEVHGSGYHDMERICMDLAAQGYYADMIEYYGQGEEVVPGEREEIRKYFGPWSHKIHDGLEALSKNAAVDPKRIAVMGYSLGGLLALSLGARHPDQVAAVVDYYGPLPPSVRDNTASMPPTLIIHGGKDRLVSAQSSRDLDQLLTQAGRPHQLKLYPEADHAFNLEGSNTYDASDAQDAWTVTLDFLRQYLKGGPSGH